MPKIFENKKEEFRNQSHKSNTLKTYNEEKEPRRVPFSISVCYEMLTATDRCWLH